MNHRRVSAIGSGLAALATMALLALAQPRIAGQTPATAGAPAKSQKTAPIPRTPDGHPDFQGIWINGTTTPFERPANLGDKEFYTEEEVAAVERQAAERRATPAPRRAGDVGTDNEAFMDTGYKIASTRQTSLVIDPPDGRVQILPEAEKQRDFNTRSADTFEMMSPWDRCITRGPTALFPANYNNGYQIVQTPGFVTIVSEMIHDARVIPMDGSPHLPSSMREWNGDSRGRWDGPTLVVDTTNFDDKGWLTTHAGSGRLRGVPITATLHLVERFSLTDANTITYQMTIDDPKVYARPWTVQIPFARDDHYQMFEYACVEGNQAIGNILRGARREERDAVPKN